jgi:Fic family protein
MKKDQTADTQRGSFAPGFLEAISFDQATLSAVRAIGEFKGRQELYRQFPAVLESLKNMAMIQSTEASNRIEGVTAPSDRIRDLVEHKTTPQNRSENEIAGYRDVLATIHTNAPNISLTPNVILQFHRDLYGYLPGQGGHSKSTDNDIVEFQPDGTVFVRFKPVPAYLTATAVEELTGRYREIARSGTIEPLVSIAAFVLDFLCIHPFLDGNGRMARLLTLLLLYQSGYEVGRYVSLEKTIEESKETYYESLLRSSQGWHEGRHDLSPWLEYFLGVLIAAYKQLESRVGAVTQARGAKRQLVVDCVRRLPAAFQIGELISACPGISRPTINRALADLQSDGEIACTGKGRYAIWKKLRD